MRVALRISDGKILEAQSNDAAPMDALVTNVIETRGYKPEDVEFKIMPDAEVDAAIKAQNKARLPQPGPTLEERVAALEAKVKP